MRLGRGTDGPEERLRGPYRAPDWADKLRGHVAYAEKHAAQFRVIWPLTEIHNKLLFLDIHNAKKRATVSDALTDNEMVESIFRYHGIDY